MTEAKYCPFRSAHCDEQCAVWDSKENRCSLVSIAQCSRRLQQIECEIVWLRRAVEDNGTRL